MFYAIIEFIQMMITFTSGQGILKISWFLIKNVDITQKMQKQHISSSTTSCFRRQTAEEREQERQAATKYFLSMQLGSLPPPPPPPPAAPHPPPVSLIPSQQPPPVTPTLTTPLLDKDDPSAISALESLRPWTNTNVESSA